MNTENSFALNCHAVIGAPTAILDQEIEGERCQPGGGNENHATPHSLRKSIKAIGQRINGGWAIRTIKHETDVVETVARRYIEAVGIIYAKVEAVVLLSRFCLHSLIRVTDVYCDQMIE